MKPSLALCSGILALLLLAAAAPGQTTTAPGSYDPIVKTYLEGPPDQLEALVAKLPRDGAGLTALQKAELTYLWQAAQEARPAWWKACKAGKNTFKAAVWGRPITVNFDPVAKQMQSNTTNGVTTVTLSWPQADMDNPAEAEHGFSKGELQQLGIWQTLGTVDASATLPLDALMNQTEAQKLLLGRYLDFRGTVTGVYYALPKARRWALWLACAGYMDKYSKMPTIMSRKALAAMFVAEVVGHRDRYPSITLPATFPAEKPEEALALHLKTWVEKNVLPVGEDRVLREAIKAFAVASEKGVRENARVTLPNGLLVALDPAQDAANQARRDAWLKAMWEKTAKKP